MGKITLEQENRTLKSQRAVTDKTLAKKHLLKIKNGTLPWKTLTPACDLSQRQGDTAQKDSEDTKRTMVSQVKQQLQGKLKTNGNGGKVTDVFP